MSDRAFALVLFTFAFFARFAAAFLLDESRAVLPDSVEYLAIADHIVEGKGIVLDENARAKRPPVYPIFLAPFRGLFGASIKPIQIAQAFLGGISCILVFLIGLRAFGRWTASWAGLACAVYPMLVFTGPAILIEGLHIALLLLEVWLLMREKPWFGLAAGVVGGVGALLHPGHALFFVAVLLYRRRRFAIPYAVAMVCVIGIWTARNASVLGRFVPLTTQSGYALYEAYGPEATGGTVGHQVAWPAREGRDEVEYDRLLRKKALEGATPKRAAVLAIQKQRRFWSVIPNTDEYRSAAATVAALCFLPVIALFFVGVGKWRLAAPGAGWVLLPVLYYAALHCVFIGSIRYRLAIEPFLILIACWGLSRIRSTRTP